MDDIYQRIKSLLQIAFKANKVALGHDSVVRLLVKKKVLLLILANDLSENSYLSVTKYTKDSFIDIINLENKEFYFQIFGKYTGIVGILDENFKNGLKKLFSLIT